jgi:hypothetical protein
VIASFFNYQQVAELCVELKFSEVDTGNVGAANLAEGLLHIINDIGYPHHEVSEAIPCMVFCTSLITVPDHNGYFYTNDVKVCK